MSTVFKPRRSNKGRMDQTGTTGKYANAVLGAGELFLERQQTGTTYTEGSGTSSAPVQYRMKIGDGSTKYSSLGYADQTAVSASGSSGDANIVGNVAQNTSNGGITTTFQSLADKKVSSVTSNSSTTVANALNTVAANNTLKDILGALKQAVSLCNTAITSLNDDKANVSAIPTKTSQLTNDSGFKTTDNDTKNTAGTSNNSANKLYLCGGTSQSSSGVTTYSNSSCYTQYGNLYSGGKKVLTTNNIQIDTIAASASVYQTNYIKSNPSISLIKPLSGPGQFSTMIMFAEYFVKHWNGEFDPFTMLFMGSTDWTAQVEFNIADDVGEAKPAFSLSSISSANSATLLVEANITSDDYYNNGDEITKFNCEFKFQRNNASIGNNENDVRNLCQFRYIII